MKKQALGKGLKAFLTEDYGILKDEKYAEVDIEKLTPNPLQPRTRFDPHSIDELARSIKEAGVLQPIVVVPEDDHYRIIIGERRWRASQKIGLKRVPVLIRTMEEEKQIEAALIENLQREDLNPVEIANAYQKMIQELNCSQEEVAEKVGKDRTSVSNYIRLLKLPQKILDYLEDGTLSMGHARPLITQENPDIQVEIAAQAAKNKLSVRETEKLVNKLKARQEPKPSPPPDADLIALEDNLIKSLGTKVVVSGNRKKGHIKIFYFSLEELNQIYEKIKGEQT
jgi:ParB family chromosome partitioning protein